LLFPPSLSLPTVHPPAGEVVVHVHGTLQLRWTRLFDVSRVNPGAACCKSLALRARSLLLRNYLRSTVSAVRSTWVVYGKVLCPLLLHYTRYAQRHYESPKSTASSPPGHVTVTSAVTAPALQVRVGQPAPAVTSSSHASTGYAGGSEREEARATTIDGKGRAPRREGRAEKRPKNSVKVQDQLVSSPE
jgi:hypothetical protein